MPSPQPLSSRRIVMLAVACALAIAALYYAQPVLPLISASFGVSDAAASRIVMLGQIGYALGLFLVLPIGDRVDRRRLALCLLAVNSFAVAACALAPNFTLFGVAILASGLTTVTPQIIIPTVAGAASSETRGRAVGILLGGMSAGLLLGRTLSGLVGAVAGWRAVFALAIPLNMLLVAIVWKALPSTKPSSVLPYPQLLRSLARLFADHPLLRVACATGFLAFAAFSVLWSTIAGLMAKPPYRVGANVVGLLGLVGAVTIFAAPILGRLTDRLGARVMIVVSAVMLLIAFLLVSQAERGLWTLILALACIDLGYRSTLLANQTRIYPLQPTAQVRLNTVFMTSVFLGGAAGSLVGAFAAHWSWIGIAAAGIACALLILIVHLLSLRRATTD